MATIPNPTSGQRPPILITPISAGQSATAVRDSLQRAGWSVILSSAVASYSGSVKICIVILSPTTIFDPAVAAAINAIFPILIPVTTEPMSLPNARWTVAPIPLDMGPDAVTSTILQIVSPAPAAVSRPLMPFIPSQLPSSPFPAPPPQAGAAPVPGYHSQSPYSPYGSAPTQPPKSSLSMIEQLIADAKLVVLHPSIASFDAIQSHASMQGVLLCTAAVGVAYGIGTLLFAPGAGLFGGLIGTFFGFFLSTALAFAAAKALGGVGNFKTYAYALAVLDLPLGVADGLCSAIPPLGALTFLLSAFYGGYLAYLANRSVHRLSVGKAIIVGLVPLATLAFLVLCAVVAVTALILSSAHS